MIAAEFRVDAIAAFSLNGYSSPVSDSRGLLHRRADAAVSRP